MRIGVLIPDRRDRPRFLENCYRMIEAQTLEPSVVVCVDYAPKDSNVDITPRVKHGYDLLTAAGVDVIAIIENDDWYSPDYLKTMVENWERWKRPDLFGTCYTIYYHIALKAYYTMEHHQRASLMNTMIKPGLTFPWCVDIEPYLDLHLWQTIKNRIVFRPEKHIAIGIKHGVGLCGGGSHVLDEKGRIAKRYVNPDNGLLKSTLDEESFKFYDNYFNDITSVTMNHPSHGNISLYGKGSSNNN